MDKYELVQKIEHFAPVETQEAWDASGWAVNTAKKDIKKVLICLTVTENIIEQAKGFDIIISHHPLFFVPLDWRFIDIYCAHTNFDLAEGGTTDTLIEFLFDKGMTGEKLHNAKTSDKEFLRYVDTDISVVNFAKILKHISANMHYVNNKNIKTLKRIAFCAGSGSEFIKEAKENGADALVTGDIKFHTALESPIVLYDIGHFESEIMSLQVLKKLIEFDELQISFAYEKSPFIY